MPFNGSGTYSLPAGNPVVTGTTISSSTHNSTMSDIATALTNCLAKDGQTTVTGNIRMGGFKLTNLANGSAATDSVTLQQLQAQTGVYVGTVGGTADVITLTPSPAITAYAAGQRFSFLSSGANTTNVTVNVSSLGAKAITKFGSTALVANDISAASVLLTIEYDGTQFQLLHFLTTGTSGNKVPLLNGANTWSAVQTHSAQVRWAKGADVASAGALTLGTDGNYFDITGTTTITSIGTLGVGTVVRLHFDGALTLTHHATDLILPGAANITTAAGDEFEFVEYATGDWRCTGYALASGKAIIVSGDVQSFTSNGTWTKPAGYATTSRVLVQGWGAGGSGANGGATDPGSGGGGGAYLERWFALSELGATETVTIGQGGAAPAVGNNGNAGGNTTLGSLFTAYGGGGGITNASGGAGGGGGGGEVAIGQNGNTTGSNVAGGALGGGYGGAAAASAKNNGGPATTLWGGGGGGNGPDTGGGGDGGTAYWGGGGGGGQDASVSADGAGGTSYFGGNGGAAGINGTVPGGGGGGASNGIAGAGANGKLIVTIFA